MAFMEKWSSFTNNMFGDFVSPKYRYGIWRNSPSDYYISRFNEHNKKDGLSAHRLPSGSVEFAKYEHDVVKYPIITIEKKGNVTTGRIIIQLEKVNAAIITLAYNSLDTSFEYYLANEKGEKVSSFSFEYTGRNREIAFLDVKSGKRLVVPEKFEPEKPIASFDELGFDDLYDFNDFEYIYDDTVAFEKNDTQDDSGVGCIVWDDQYSIGEWKDGLRTGWQIYQWEGFYQVFNSDCGRKKGMLIEYDEEVKAVTIYAVYPKEDDENEYSSALVYNKRVLYFVDPNYKGKDFGPREDTTGLTIPSFDHVNFVKWTRTGTWNFENNHLENSYDAYLMYSELKDDEIVLESHEEIERKMMNLIGQKEAKNVFIRLRAYLMKNDAEKPPIHMVFTGGNGVGKSTVARLFTELLYEFHAIDKNNLKEVNAQTLFNSYTGETKSRIEEVYEDGKGGVILIDDFHYLDAMNSSNIKEGIEKISSLMHSDPRTTFILVDTKFNMKQVMDDNLESLSDIIRFRVNFSDFTKEELKQILENRIAEKKYGITEDGMSKLLDVIFLSKSYGNNINASAALSILEEVIVAQNVRTINTDDSTITKEDVSTYIADNDIAFIDQKTGGQSDARKKLDELVGLDNIKEMVDDLIAYFNINRGKKVDFHMVFTGNPGTGKTEVARIIGKLLRQEGILGTSRFIEVTRSDLVAEYVGQTAVKTKTVIEKAMGGVLYIDEAYSLAYGGDKDFGAEAVAELLKAMEDRRGEFCVIMAGYTSEMKKLFDLNPGLKSRVKFNLNFPDYTDEEIEKILRLFLKRDNNTMSEENIKLMVSLVTKQRRQPNFANVRTLREYLSRVQIKQARRIGQSQNENVNLGELTIEDIVATFGKNEIDVLINGDDRKVVSKVNPNKLKEDYACVKDMLFTENKSLVSEAVVAITIEGEHKGESSGFIVSKDGYVITCAHCVSGATKIRVRRRLVHRNKNIDICYDAKIVSLDEKADLAVIKLESEKGEEFDFVALESSDRRIEPLSEICLLGYPFGVSRFDAISVNMGRIVSYQKDEQGNEQINLDVSAKGGNSGSLVIDAETSKVVGVLVGSSVSYQGQFVEEINYCRPVKYVWSLIEKEYEKEQKEKEEKSLPNSVFNSETFTYSNNKTDFEVEYLEYLEVSKTTITHTFFSSDELQERNGKKLIHLDTGDLNLTVSGVVNDQYYLSLFREVYEYSYRKIKDIVLDEAHPIFDERIEKHSDNEWLRIMIRLIKK